MRSVPKQNISNVTSTKAQKENVLANTSNQINGKITKFHKFLSVVVGTMEVYQCTIWFDKNDRLAV